MGTELGKYKGKLPAFAHMAREVDVNRRSSKCIQLQAGSSKCIWLQAGSGKCVRLRAGFREQTKQIQSLNQWLWICVIKGRMPSKHKGKPRTLAYMACGVDVIKCGSNWIQTQFGRQQLTPSSVWMRERRCCRRSGVSASARRVTCSAVTDLRIRTQPSSKSRRTPSSLATVQG